MGHLKVAVVVAGGSVQPQPTVRVDRMAQVGYVHVAVQAFRLEVTVGQTNGVVDTMGLPEPGAMMNPVRARR